MTRQTYPDYQNACGWNALLESRTPSPPLSTDSRADLVVIGAGYTGIAAARQWARVRSDDEVTVLDAADIGEGNPGRNSGFLLEIMLANDVDPTAIDRMQRANRLIGQTMHRLRDDVFDAGIPCDIERSGTYRAAAGAAGRRALAAYRRFLDRMALPFEHLESDVLEHRLGTGYYEEGLYSPHCYLVQPAALIRGLAGLLPDSVTLCERSPALSVMRAGNDWCVRTPQAEVRAGKVLVTNNAFAKTLGPGASQLVAMYTYAGLTPPMPDWCGESGGSEASWGLLPAHRLGCTLRRTRDDRLLIRAQYDYESESDNSRIAAELLSSLKKRFPDLPAGAFDHVWGGATGFTLNGAPLWGEVRPGLYVSAGCNGGGVVKGSLFGELLADLALGRDAREVDDLFGAARWMPPEPIRRLAFEILSRIERHKGREEM